MKVGIIGGGFTGLACATVLAESGCEVVLYEKNPKLGGLAAGFKELTWTSHLESYYHHWFKTDRAVSRFAEIWGASDGLYFKRPSTVFQTERHGFVPLDSAASLLRYPELNLTSKVRMGLGLSYLKLTKNWQKLEKISAVDWCTRYLGVEGFEAIWKPLLQGKFGVRYAAEINMAWLWARLHCRTPELGTYMGGFDAFVDRAERFLLGKGVRIFKDARDLRLDSLREGWTVAALNHGIQEHDAVVIAASPSAFAALASAHAPEHVRATLGQPALGVQVVVLSLNQPLGNHYWYSLKRSNAQPFLAAIEHTNFVDPSYFGGEHLIYFAKYVDVKSEEWNETDEQLLELALMGCPLINSKFSRGHLIRGRVFRNEYAQPVVGLNASRNVPSIHVHGVPRLFHGSLAHVYPWDRGTNYALELGEKIAQAILKSA